MTSDLNTRLTNAAWSFAVIAAMLLVWEGAVKLFKIPGFLLPSIEDVVLDLVRAPGFYLHHAAYTLTTALTGFGGAILLGIVLSFAIVSSRIWERIFMTFLAVIHSIPKVALAPLFVIWMGTGASPKIGIAVLTSIFTIVVDLIVGMQSIDPEVVNMARVKRASGAQILFKIRFPHALPNLFGALKAAAAFALVGAVVGEFVGGQRGLGYVILVAQGDFDTARAFAAVFLLGILGTLMFYAVNFAEARLMPWHVSQRVKGVAASGV